MTEDVAWQNGSTAPLWVTFQNDEFVTGIFSDLAGLTDPAAVRFAAQVVERGGAIGNRASTGIAVGGSTIDALARSPTPAADGGIIDIFSASKKAPFPGIEPALRNRIESHGRGDLLQ